MKLASIGTIVLLGLCLTLRAEPRLANAVVAIVNDSVITLKDIQKHIAPDVQLLREMYGPSSKQFEDRVIRLRQESLDRLVERELILHEFETGGFNIPESFIQNRIDEDIRNYGDRLTLTKTLQAKGITQESYRKQVRENVILELMWKHHVPRDPLISPQKIEDYYEANKDEFKLEDQIKLRMIVFPQLPSEPSYSPKKMAQEVLTKIRQGASFAEMARIYSQGSKQADGGDLGWIDHSVLRADLTEEAFSLESGKCSDVIQADEACYLMLVEERKSAHVRPLSEVRDEIESTLKSREYDRLRKRWIERLKEKAFVRYF